MPADTNAIQIPREGLHLWTFGPLHEATIWILGLAAVALADPTAPALFEACLFKAVGLPWCPGCGLGHAMGFLARGEWQLALQSHPLSPLVLGVLIHRIVSLLRSPFSDSSNDLTLRVSHVKSHQVSS